jgi:glucosamine--fructose-6-phosphate aminotransferase (isomerizing)
MSLHSEIHEQPTIIQGLLGKQSEITRIATEIRKIDPAYVFLAARGTSDNAGRYANYMWGAYNHLPVALATPSLFTYYQQMPKLNGALITAVSQSGQSPDIIAVVDEGKRQGCASLAITNAPDSPLAHAANFVIDIAAGPEKAVAATKTYTAELLAMALLSVELADDDVRRAELQKLPIWAQQVLALDEEIARLAERFRYMEHCVVIGRGFNYATAFEWSLKLKELTYSVAEPYSTADFQHGPIAMVERGFPVFVAAPSGIILPDMLPLLRTLRETHHAELTIISDSPEALALAQSPIQLPAGIPEWLSPIIAIIPAQLFCYHLTRTRGFDTEAPRTIRKVTETH